MSLGELFFPRVLRCSLTNLLLSEPLADALLVNCLQVWRYLESYSESSGLPSAELFSLYSVLQVARSLHSEHRGGRGESGSLLSAVQHYRQFLNGSIGLGRRLWTQYDLLLMALGTFLQATFLAVLATRLLIGSNSSLMPAAPMLIWGSALGLIVGAGLAAAAPVHLQPEGVASIAAAGSCLGLLVHMFKGRHNLLPSDFSPRSWSAEEWAAGMVTVLYCGCLFSNSFIIEEHGLHLFLGSTALVVLACMYYKQDPVAAGLCAVAVICLRTAAASTSLFVGTDVSATFSVPTSILPLPLILAIFLRSLHACRWYWVHSGVLILSSLCTAAFWWVEVSSGVAVGSSLRIILPRLVYAGSLLGYFVSLNRGSVCEPVAQLRETSIAVVAHFSSILVLLLGPASPVTIFLFIVGAALLARASNIAESKRASSSHKALLPAYPLTLVCRFVSCSRQKQGFATDCCFFFQLHVRSGLYWPALASSLRVTTVNLVDSKCPVHSLVLTNFILLLEAYCCSSTRLGWRLRLFLACLYFCPPQPIGNL
jgi:hypothetical protein